MHTYKLQTHPETCRSRVVHLYVFLGIKTFIGEPIKTNSGVEWFSLSQLSLIAYSSLPGMGLCESNQIYVVISTDIVIFGVLFWQPYS